MSDRDRLRHLIEAPVRDAHLARRGKPYSFDTDQAVALWRSGDYPTITALAIRLGAERRAVSDLLHQRGLIGREPPANGHG